MTTTTTQPIGAANGAGPIITITHKFRDMSEDRRPQDPGMNGEGWTFETMEHGGEYPDMMPQAIKATDAEGRSCIYTPVSVDGRVVDSILFNYHTDFGTTP